MAIGRILVGLAVVVCAFITIALLGVDAEGLAEHSVHIQAYRGCNPTSRRSIGDAGSEVYGREVLAGSIRPLHRLTGGGELNISMARRLKLWARKLRCRRRCNGHHGSSTGNRPRLRLVTGERGGCSNDGASPVLDAQE